MTTPTDRAVYFTVVLRDPDESIKNALISRDNAVAFSASHAIHERDAFEELAASRARKFDTDQRPAGASDAELPDSIRVPLDKLWADAGYLMGRVAMNGSLVGAMADVIRSRVDEAKSAITAALRQRVSGGDLQRLRASIGAIHCMADRVSPETIRAECEHAIPELAALGKGGE